MRSTKNFGSLVLIFGVTMALCQVGCSGKKQSEVVGPAPAVHGMTSAGEMAPSSEDRCPICAMTPKKEAKFVSAIELDDGKTFYFCGTGCMLRTWLKPKHFLGVDPKRVKRAFVKDYFQGKTMDAVDAFFVAGSDVVGPMGPAIVPLASEADRDEFVKRHSGKHMFRLGELNDELWLEMKGRPVVGE
jgi:copper chaperone NosL